MHTHPAYPAYPQPHPSRPISAHACHLARSLRTRPLRTTKKPSSYPALCLFRPGTRHRQEHVKESKSKAYVIPEHFPYDEARRLFLQPEVIDGAAVEEFKARMLPLIISHRLPSSFLEILFLKNQ